VRSSAICSGSVEACTALSQAARAADSFPLAACARPSSVKNAASSGVSRASHAARSAIAASLRPDSTRARITSRSAWSAISGYRLAIASSSASAARNSRRSSASRATRSAAPGRSSKSSDAMPSSCGAAGGSASSSAAAGSTNTSATPTASLATRPLGALRAAVRVDMLAGPLTRHPVCRRCRGCQRERVCGPMQRAAEPARCGRERPRLGCRPWGRAWIFPAWSFRTPTSHAWTCHPVGDS